METQRVLTVALAIAASLLLAACKADAVSRRGNAATGYRLYVRNHTRPN
jgi:outer membrane biogenesis lipoprotein LolB